MSADFFTRRIMGMDYLVWRAMLITCCLTVILFGFKLINGQSDPACPDATITVDGQPMESRAVCYIGRLTMFKIQAEGIAKVEWNFKDGGDDVTGLIAPHRFVKEGDYKVIATLNGRCSVEGFITVKRPPGANDREGMVVKIFPSPSQPKVGSTVDFHFVSNVTANSYQWKLLGTNKIQESAVATFLFNEPGKYTVQLVINNNPSTVTNEVIEVFPLASQEPQIAAGGTPGTDFPRPVAPPPILIDQGIPNPGGNASTGGTGPKTSGADTGASKPAASRPKPVDVDPTTFMGELQEVIYGNKDLEELYRYLDYKGSTMVKVNEEPSLIPLTEFCKKMKNEKKKRNKIETLSFKKDDKNSIQTIQVKVPRKEGLFDKLWPFN